MILYFIAGFISGAVGVLMVGRHLSKKMEMMKNDKRTAGSP